ncbi:MAG: aminoacetone oxidase family FAD-binding enzyme, partial [Lachnospiraceae bacterium]|nr:aminoacetone oxidase family FAD-binding enzyme [Lachnospiraceae bacterium]
MSNIAIIGGGAAGMMAAIGAAVCGHEVHIYEKNEKLGKKIYITGKGRCNVTNASDMDMLFKSIVTNPKFMYSAFYTLSNDTVIQMFNDDMSVPTKIERGNRVFPVSDKSSDIIIGLTRRLRELGVNIHLGYNVKELVLEKTSEDKDKVKGIRLTDGEVIKADSVIVATGGFSYQTTGSDGAGYKFAKDTGHKVTDILPALVPLNTKEEFVKRLQGLSLKNIKV